MAASALRDHRSAQTGAADAAPSSDTARQAADPFVLASAPEPALSKESAATPAPAATPVSGKAVVLCASPQPEGTCAHLARAIAERLRKEGFAPVLFELAEMDIHPCVGGNTCARTTDNACVYDDDFTCFDEVLSQAQTAVVVSPVFFAGPPAGYKALLDRMQPHFHRAEWKHDKARKPLTLVVVGEGGDPHGFEPLVACTRAAFAVAKWRLETVVPCIGTQPETACELVERILKGGLHG